MIVDTFERTDLGPDWVQQSGQFIIETGHAKPDAMDTVAFHVTEMEFSDHYAEITANGLAFDQAAVIRGSNMNTYYMGRYWKGQVEIYKRISGTFTKIASAAQSQPSVPYRVRLDAIGSSLKLHLNDVVKLDIIDESIQVGTFVGMRSHRPGLQSFDLFQAGPTSIIVDTLADLIAATPDGVEGNSNVIDGQGATFATEETTLISNRHHLIIQNFTVVAETTGVAATPWNPHLWPRLRQHIRVDQGSSYITLKDVTIQGPHPNAGYDGDYWAQFEGQSAFCVDDGANHVDILNCSAFDPYGDFIFVRGNDVVIRGNSFLRSGRQGIAISNAKNVTIDGNNIGHTRRSIFDLETDTDLNVIDNVTIENNNTSFTRHLWLACAGRGSNVTNITVRNNVMGSATGVPIIQVTPPDGHRRANFTVTDNSFIAGGSPNPALLFKGIDGLTINNNNIQFMQPATNMIAVNLRDSCTGVRMTDNIFIDNAVDYHVT